MDAGSWDGFVDRAHNGTLFHTMRFLGYHPPGRFAWDHAALESETGEVLALLPAASVEEGETWWSGAGASFGGPVLAPDAGAGGGRRAAELLLAEAKRRGYRRVRLTPPPPIYERDGTGIVREALRAAGFRVSSREVFQAAPLASTPVADLLSGPARRGAGKAEREGVEVLPGRDYGEFHSLLERDRGAVGAAPVHSAAELEDLAVRLGDRQALLLARRGGDLVAGSWVLRANDRVGLSFYVCQDREHRRLRATNLLLLRALEWAAGRGLAHYDFGTSSIGGTVNEGLYAFKEAHGGRPYDRETFEREV